MRWRWLLLLILPLIALFAGSAWRPVGASLNDNVRGRGWNPTYGLISFNCLDDDFSGTFPFTFTFSFNTPPCSLSTHGVNIDNNNNFSGEAWNPTLGFINFAPAVTPPDNYAFNSHCQSQCDAGNNCTACYNDADQRVYGWAQVENDGRWLELNSSVSPQTTITNYTNPQPGIFSGYASSSFGTISFNCSNDSSCGSQNYYVYMWPLELKMMTAPNWNASQACVNGARETVFKWYRRSGTQTAYRVVVNTTNSSSSPVFDSGKIVGSASQLVCPGSLCSFTPAYGQSYYWWLQLWDENDNPTELFQFDTNNYGVLTDNATENAAAHPSDSNLTFTNYKHEFPLPSFTWTPTDIIIGTSTEFDSQSRYFTSASPNTNSLLCPDGSCQFAWSVSDGAALITAPTHSTTSIVFYNNQPKTISLQVTDPDQYTCSTSSPVLQATYELPIWKEIKAQ